MTFSWLKKKILCRFEAAEESSDSLDLDLSRLPTHVGLIMDGNGRWAKERGLPRIAGHRQGKIILERIGDEAMRLGIKYLTVYAFSSENWLRPQDEVSGLMDLLYQGLQKNLKTFIKRQVRLRFIGDRSRLSPTLEKALEEAEEKTQHLDAFHFTIALSYGSRQEIVEAVRSIGTRLTAGEISAKEIDEGLVSKALYTHDMPDPDLIIRTSGEARLSNFLLWQAAYSELAFVETYWPDFSPEVFRDVLKDYQKRERRYGKISEQL